MKEEILATPEQQAENIKTLNRIKEMYPSLGEDDIGEFLMSTTAFPFADLQYCLTQLEKLYLKSGSDHKSAIRISYEEFDKVWESTREERERGFAEEEKKYQDMLNKEIKQIVDNNASASILK